MTHAIEIGYVNVEVSDPGGFATFLTDIIGLTPSEPTPTGEATWTDDAAVQRVIVSDGPRNDLAAVGFEAVDVAAFDATIERLGASGFGVETADGPLVAARRVERMAVADAPWGTPVEVCVGLERTARARSPLMTGGFRTEGQGFGHAVIATTAFDESVRFVIEGLGMAESDWLLTEIAEGIQLEVRFFHCNARHHSLALARAPFELPQRLHHLMFETNERDDVGRAYDRAFDGGLELPNGLGRHDNDGMFSFYVASPAGFQIEVGHGARQITEPWADDRQYDRISVWGAISPSRHGDARPVTTEVILTGTGVPHPRPGRAGAGTLVRCGEVAVQFDAGRSTVMRLMEAGTPPPALTALFVTHVHSDHVVGLADLAMTRWVQQQLVPSGPLVVVAPEGGSARFVRRMLEPYDEDLALRIHHVGADPIEVDVRPFDASPVPVEVWRSDDGTVGVSAVAVHHEPVPDAVAYRVDTPDGAVVISGDTRVCDEVEHLAAGADVLVHEACRTSALSAIIAGTAFETIFSYHADTIPLGAMAARAGVPHVMLTHLIPPPDSDDDAAAFEQDLRDGGYTGRVTVGEDLVSVTIG